MPHRDSGGGLYYRLVVGRVYNNGEDARMKTDSVKENVLF